MTRIRTAARWIAESARMPGVRAPLAAGVIELAAGLAFLIVR